MLLNKRRPRPQGDGSGGCMNAIDRVNPPRLRAQDKFALGFVHIFSGVFAASVGCLPCDEIRHRLRGVGSAFLGRARLRGADKYARKLRKLSRAGNHATESANPLRFCFHMANVVC